MAARPAGTTMLLADEPDSVADAAAPDADSLAVLSVLVPVAVEDSVASAVFIAPEAVADMVAVPVAVLLIEEDAEEPYLKRDKTWLARKV